MNARPLFEDVVRFHGHICPGLAMGYRMTLAGLNGLFESKGQDEEIVAIVENDACGVDAVQFVAGCTFGKGNLVFCDYGKSVYTFYSRKTGAGVRVAWRHAVVPDDVAMDRTARVNWILQAPQDSILWVQPAHMEAPQLSSIRESVLCDRCGERVMETRICRVGVQNLCIPCRSRVQTESQ